MHTCSRDRIFWQSRLAMTVMTLAACSVLAAPRIAVAATGMYLTDRGNDEIEIYNLGTHALAHQVSVGDGPRGIAIRGSTAYVVNTDAGTVSIVNLASNSVTATVSVGNQPMYAVVSGTGIYVTNYGGNSVSVIDSSNNAVEKTIAVGATPWTGVVSGTGIYITNYGGTTVSLIDTTNNVVERTITGLNQPMGIATSGTGIYVTNSGNNTVSVIDTQDKVVERSIAGFNVPVSILIRGTGAFIGNWGNNTVSLLDIAGSVIDTTFSSFSEPYAIAASGTGVYVANSLGANVTVIDVVNNQSERVISTGTSMGIAMYANSDFTTQTPTLSAPAGSALYGRSLTVDFTLPETASAGSVTLNFNNGGGTSVTATLTDTASASFTLNLDDLSASAHVASATDDSVPDGLYTVTLSYQDAAGNPAATDSNTDAAIASTTSCPPGYAPGASASTRYGSTCFAFYTTARTYAAANAACRSMLGTLAVSNSSVKHWILRTLGSYAWIGLSDAAAENTFVWEDGSAYSYTNWDGTQPNGGSGENCVLMENGALWHDYNCDTASQYFCQLPIGTAEASTPSGGGSAVTAGGGRRTLPAAAEQASRGSSSAPSTGSSAAPYFIDVPFSAWFYRHVETLRIGNIVSGYADAKGAAAYRYGPADPVTYGQLAKLIALITKRAPADSTAKQHWAEPYVREARSHGLSVFMDERLNLDTPATRGTVARTILQAYGITLEASPQSSFTDLPALHPYAKDLLTAAALGIITGDAGKGTVRPDAPVNRAEIAKILAQVSANFTPVARALPPASSAPAIPAHPGPKSAGMLQDIRTVQSQDTRIRNDSRVSATTLWFAHKGDVMEVLEIVHTDWAHVRLQDGREGYVLIRDLGK